MKAKKSKMINYPPESEMKAKLNQMTRNELLRFAFKADKKLRAICNAFDRIEESRVAEK